LFLKDFLIEKEVFCNLISTFNFKIITKLYYFNKKIPT
jgi:hypothetical protein